MGPAEELSQLAQLVLVIRLLLVSMLYIYIYINQPISSLQDCPTTSGCLVKRTTQRDKVQYLQTL